MSQYVLVNVRLLAPEHLSMTEVAEMVDDKLRAAGSVLVVDRVWVSPDRGHALAQEGRPASGMVMEGSGQRGASRKLDQVVSARLDSLLVEAVRAHARAHGMSFSDVLREALVQYVQHAVPEAGTGQCQSGVKP
jgi:hypothetical protein